MFSSSIHRKGNQVLDLLTLFEKSEASLEEGKNKNTPPTTIKKDNKQIEEDCLKTLKPEIEEEKFEGKQKKTEETSPNKREKALKKNRKRKRKEIISSSEDDYR